MKQIAILLPLLVLAVLMATAFPAFAEATQQSAAPAPGDMPSTMAASESAAAPESAGDGSVSTASDKSPAGATGHTGGASESADADSGEPAAPAVKPQTGSAPPPADSDFPEPDYKTLTAQVWEVRPLYTASGDPMEGHRSLWVVLDEGGEAVLSMTDEETITTGKPPAEIAPGDKVAFTYDTKAPAVLIYPPRYTPVKVEVVP